MLTIGVPIKSSINAVNEKIQGVVFDFDGTLVNSNSIKRESFYSVVKDIQNGEEILNDIFSRNLNIDRYQTFALFAELASVDNERYISVSNVEWGLSLAVNYSRICDERVIKCNEVSGASRVLNELYSEGKRLFVNSATPTDSLKKIIVHRHLNHFFEKVYGAPSNKIDNLKAIIEVTKLTARSIVVVGDGLDDKSAANELGCHFIGVGNSALREASPAPFILDSFTDIPIVIRQLSK